MRIYVAVLVLVVVVGVFLARMLPVEQEGVSSILFEEAALLTPLLPPADEPSEVLAEFALPFAQNVFDVRPRPVPSLSEAPQPAVKSVEQERPAPLPAPAPVPSVMPVSAVPVSFVYFFNGTCVTAFTSVRTVPMVYTTAPMASPSVVMPVFVPQVVPSRVGMPKWVYPNGVVIKPKACYPHQPVRNSFRVVIP